jgi:RNA polymerase sigma-70 factor (ECF subfamily)
MSNDTEFLELIEKARCGDRVCSERLADEVRVRLQGYALRLTMNEELSDDIVQESILEMFKTLGKLKKMERFWPWLYGIAFNKVRCHYDRKQRHKTVPLSYGTYDIRAKDGPDGLAELVTAEWKQIVVKSMEQLAPRHRAVLAMRCYDQMKYSEIAKIMGSSEFGVRALFFRAKKSLAKRLAHNGLGKGALPAGLILFGKLTATSEAAVANISVTSATLKVGVLAGAAAMASSKSAVVSLATVAFAVGGTLALAPDGNKAAIAGRDRQAKISSVLQGAKSSEGVLECWYFFPEGSDGAVMTRGMKRDKQGKALYCQWLQNGRANYFFDNGDNTIHINNHRMWGANLSVQRLPTDSHDMSEFLSQVESDECESGEYVKGRDDGLLAIAQSGTGQGNTIMQMMHHRNLLSEDYFQFDWPAGAKIVDNRDAMHRRGWTYFRIAGELGGQPVRGVGRLPFVYAASEQYYPWLKLEIGGAVLVDTGDGRLFKGLSRPWAGLHTIDTVRRDAAEEWMPFETEYKPGEVKAQVALAYESDKLIYTIDMEKDVVEKIVFSGDVIGELRFSYLQDIEDVGKEFAEPRERNYAGLENEGAHSSLYLFGLGYIVRDENNSRR